jgi:hypothetical protein
VQRPNAGQADHYSLKDSVGSKPDQFGNYRRIPRIHEGKRLVRAAQEQQPEGSDRLRQLSRPNRTFFDVQQKSQITAFLDTKVKPPEQDPEKRWITTYNHYLRRIKLFYRWLYNQRGKDDIDDDPDAMAD